MSEQLKRLALAAYQAKVDAQNKAERKASEQIMDLLRKELSAEVLDGLPDFTFTYEPWGAELKASVHFFCTLTPSGKSLRPSKMDELTTGNFKKMR